jgi:hypothetical protein
LPGDGGNRVQGFPSNPANGADLTNAGEVFMKKFDYLNKVMDFLNKSQRNAALVNAARVRVRAFAVCD